MFRMDEPQLVRIPLIHRKVEIAFRDLDAATSGRLILAHRAAGPFRAVFGVFAKPKIALNLRRSGLVSPTDKDAVLWG